MDTQQDKIEATDHQDIEEGEAIEKALLQMEVLYKSRCIQAPLGSNITIREIHKEE